LVHGGEQTPRTQKVTLSFSVLCRFSGAGIILDNATCKVV
jgi:hypothetical protein